MKNVKISMVNMLRALIEEVKNMKEQMDSLSIEMDIKGESKLNARN